MALKGDRKITDGSEISYFMNETGERGVVVIQATASSGSGAALEDSGNVVSIPTDTAGNPAGILLNDVVNKDLTRTHLNQHKDEVQVRSKVTVVSRGRVVTDQVVTGSGAIPGSGAYFTANGKLTSTAVSTRVGTFRSAADADGFAAVDVTIA